MRSKEEVVSDVSSAPKSDVFRISVNATDSVVSLIKVVSTTVNREGGAVGVHDHASPVSCIPSLYISSSNRGSLSMLRRCARKARNNRIGNRACSLPFPFLFFTDANKKAKYGMQKPCSVTGRDPAPSKALPGEW